MCILIHIPSKAQRPNEAVLRECWTSNPDGAGFMYPDKTRNILAVSKGHMTLDALLEAFKGVPDKVPVSVHFRIRTHGAKSPEMTHPHIVWPDEVAIAHNGILAIGGDAKSDESDTARFARHVLAKLPKKWFLDAALVHLVEEYMGRGNKMVAMDKSGQVAILNETAGTWEGGVWYSNQSFRVSRYTSYKGYSSGYDAYEETWPYEVPTHPAGSAAAAAQVPAPVASGGTTAGTGAGAGSTASGTRYADVMSIEDQEILLKDIGNMTVEEFARYEALMTTVEV
jgi:hypothetical protein